MSEQNLEIKKQGFYSAGGSVQKTEGTFDPIHGQMAPEGQLRHSDHANVFFQEPAEGNGRKIMFLPGYGQSRVSYMSTPDGRPGFSDIFLKKGYGVYLLDQPRRGEAGQSSVPVTISAKPDDLNWFTQFRLGLWPNFMDNTQFPTDDESVDQFFRQMTPDTGEIDFSLIESTTVAALKKSGPSILMTHSQGGVPGWFIGMQSDDVEAIVALEPGAFVFPKDEAPEKIITKYPMANEAIPVSDEEYAKLIKKPIVVYYGDNIPTEPSDVPAWDFWRGSVQMAHKFADVVNAHGGDAKIVELPKEGIKGNDHFMFQDLNNQEIADHIAKWLTDRNL